MLYRAAAISIVLFWLSMTTLLINTEINPGDSRLKAVPIEHVLKLMFHHAQISDLRITSGKQPLGNVRVQPKIVALTQARTLDFDGNVRFKLAGSQRQRVAWQGLMEMDRALNLQRLKIDLLVHEPEQYRVDFLIDSLARTGRMRALSFSGEQVLEQHTYSLDQKGANELIERLGISPAMLQAFGSTVGGTAGGTAGGTPMSTPQISARQSQLTIHGEVVETFLVSVEQNGQTFVELQVNQIGQILLVKTFLGYSLAPDDLSP